MDSHPAPPPLTRRLLLVAGAAMLLRPAWAADDREISWDDLVPEDWDPMKSFGDLQHLSNLPDSDPRVQQMYERMRKVWDEAPTVPSLAGQSIKLPGYLVPLESGNGGIREFLLVPYFGACIHTPPPPANQIIHVRSASPLKGLKTMDAVWVSGKLGIERGNSEMGVSGYSLSARGVRKYEPPK